MNYQNDHNFSKSWTKETFQHFKNQKFEAECKMMTIIMFLEGKMNDSESILQAQKPTRWSTLRGGESGKTDFELVCENFFLPSCS